MSKAAFKGGVHPAGRKEATSGTPIEEMPVPARLVVPMSQHLGAPCEPTVEVGDRVVRGQVIGATDAMVSAPIHSPVSGEVTAIGPTLTTGGTRVTAVSVTPDETQDLASFERVVAEGGVPAIVRAAGVVGMGGATFPSAVKLRPPNGMEITTLILNGCECEPFLTCDDRLMVEMPERIIAGAKIMAETVGAQRIVAGVEDNKPDAIAALREAGRSAGVEVVGLVTRYPQGAEKQLIWAIMGVEVPHGQLPAATGALVHNVATAAAVADAVERGKPLTERVVTVTGRVARPGNYRVLLGTLVADLIDHAGGTVGEVGRIIAGGPMTGQALASLDVPVTKGTSGIVVLGPDEAAPDIHDDQPCIRCGRCPEACPMYLEPYAIANYAYRREWKAAEEFHPIDCIECGVCSYVCPTKRPLLQLIRLAKATAMQKGAKL